MQLIKTAHSPHIAAKGSVRAIMTDVLIALIPSMLAAVLFFGYHVIVNIFFCVLFCGISEFLFNAVTVKNLTKEGIKRYSVFDLSFAVTGTLLALNLPPYLNIWGLNIVSNSGAVLFSFDTVLVCLIGSVFAIVLVKMVFGGIGRNFANPALTARIFLMVSFGAHFAAVGSGGIIAETGATWANVSTGATWLSGKIVTTKSALTDMFLGSVGSAAVGETSVLAIIIGYIYLSVRKVIDFRIPLMVLGWAALFSVLFVTLPSGYTLEKTARVVAAELMSGGLFFGAVFMATDYATSPNTFLGNAVYCFGIGLIVMLIRAFGSYPEGMSYAVVLMNIVVPIIDKFIYPKPFGYREFKRAEERK